MLKGSRIFKTCLFGLFLLIQSVAAQNQAKQTEGKDAPVFTMDERTFDFGLIHEEDGLATHVFVFKNTGTAPLLISHVQTSCGCTEPQWPKQPIEPGKEGQIAVTFDARNRPGPFKKNITVYTNEKTLRQRLTITGDVIPKPNALDLAFRDTIGAVQMEAAKFLFHTANLGDHLKQDIWIRNFSDEDLTLSVENAPEYLTIKAPAQLKSGKAERLRVELDGSKVPQEKGRFVTGFTWKTTGASQMANATQMIPVTVNFVDDRATLRALQGADAPALELSADTVDFGKIKSKGGFLGLKKIKTVSRPITLTNKGKTDLALYSLSCDDPRAVVSGWNQKAILPAGEALTVQIMLRPNETGTAFTTDFHVVCNDPANQVHSAHIKAERQ
ncbi:MAG: DUF1573 domain-containing protein [Tannerella sp.]|jgi:hypothetical protein|nr:DUF1573 domain-containing protein [Tannerella sp.]